MLVAGGRRRWLIAAVVRLANLYLVELGAAIRPIGARREWGAQQALVACAIGVCGDRVIYRVGLEVGVEDDLVKGLSRCVVSLLPVRGDEVERL